VEHWDLPNTEIFQSKDVASGYWRSSVKILRPSELSSLGCERHYLSHLLPMAADTSAAAVS
jgi:hypothetical protein